MIIISIQTSLHKCSCLFIYCTLRGTIQYIHYIFTSIWITLLNSHLPYSNLSIPWLCFLILSRSFLRELIDTSKDVLKHFVCNCFLFIALNLNASPHRNNVVEIFSFYTIHWITKYYAYSLGQLLKLVKRYPLFSSDPQKILLPYRIKIKANLAALQNLHKTDCCEPI